MDSRWLEDLVAIAEAKTLTDAADRRHVTQPAFSRRIQAIEEWLGTVAIDRSTRPARLKRSIVRQLPEIRSILRQIQILRRNIGADEEAQTQLTVSGLHSIISGYLPGFILSLRESLPHFGIRLISADWDECYAMLMTRQAPLLIVYESERMPIAPDEQLIEKKTLARDEFIPVATPAFIASGDGLNASRLPIISYPATTFFGETLRQDALSPLASRYDFEVICETTFVPGVLEFALAGLGVAWVPLRLARPHLASERLVRLDGELGSAGMTIAAARLNTPYDHLLEQVWNALLDFAATGDDGNSPSRP